MRYYRRRRIAKLGFSVVDDSATSECRLDNGPFQSCKLF